jgi:hypothetical protein
MRWEEGFMLPKRTRRYTSLYNNIKRMGIDPGENALHLQSVIWIARRDTLEKINGFYIGKDKAECLASEVGTCRAVAGMGLRLLQAGERSFEWIGHTQWRSGDELARMAAKESTENLV